jgi:hypothetical protein
MKCPKCGYITFDYAKTCPKCNKDIATEREKLNLPTFAPAPLSLLDTLIARAIRPDIDTEIQEPESAPTITQDLILGAEDFGAIEAMEEALSEDKDIEMDLAPRSLDLPGFAEQITDTEIQEENSLKDLPFRDSIEELSLDIEDLNFKSPITPPNQIEKAKGYEFMLEPDFSSPSEPSEGEEETFSLDFDDITVDKIEVANQQGFTEEGVNEIKLDLEELASMVEELGEEESAGYTESDITAEKAQTVSPSAEAPADDNSDSEKRGFLELDLDLEKGDEKSS